MTKPRIDPVRWRAPPSRPFTIPARKPTLTVVTVPGHAPEDIVADAVGNIWTGVDDGRIIRIDGETTEVVATTGGRPLGLAAARDGSLLICDCQRGLLRLNPVTGEIETLVAQIAGRPLMFCSNVVESSCGTIYFTESTNRFSYEHYKGAVIEGRATGSLIRRDPDGTVTVLASDLRFANGVTLTADESAIVFAESTGRRLSKYWLTGAQAGSLTPLVSHLPGYPDNISTGADGRIWVAIVSERSRMGEWVGRRTPVLRRLVWQLPSQWLPNPRSKVWVAAFDPDDGRLLTHMRTRHRDFGQVTGVVETQGQLWLGCIGASAVAHFIV